MTDLALVLFYIIIFIGLFCAAGFLMFIYELIREKLW